jgi:hypothetical protein
MLLPIPLARRRTLPPTAPHPAQSPTPPCPTARSTLAAARLQIETLHRFLASAPEDRSAVAAADLLIAAEAQAAAARAAIQHHYGALLLALRTTVTLSDPIGSQLGSAIAELLLEPDGHWGGILEHYPEGSPPAVPIPGREIQLHLRSFHRLARARITGQMPTPTRSTSIEGIGPAPFG